MSSSPAPSPTSDSSYFTDADQLDQQISDPRSQDTRMVSSRDDAKALIDTFRSSAATSPWTSLNRDEVASRLADLVNNPRLIQQGSLNLCGPAACMCMWNGRDPVGFVKYATQLFDTGSGNIGSLTVTPSAELLNQDYAGMKARMSVVSPQADWMTLGALRNSTDVFWQGTWTGDPQQAMSAMTRPEELASWLQATGIYKSVKNEANWMTCAGIPHAEGLNPQLAGYDVALLIHLNLIKAAQGQPKDADWMMSQFPNHFVVLVAEVVADLQTQALTLSIWTWGDTMISIKVPQQDFLNNYYGAVWAVLNDPPAGS